MQKIEDMLAHTTLPDSIKAMTIQHNVYFNAT